MADRTNQKHKISYQGYVIHSSLHAAFDRIRAQEDHNVCEVVRYTEGKGGKTAASTCRGKGT